MTISDQARGTLMVVVGVIFISFEGLLVRQVSTDRWTLICWRGFFSFVCISTWLLFFWRQETLSRCLRIGWTGIIAAVILTINNIFFITAFTLTSIANTLIFSDSAPLFVALLSWLILKEKVPRYTWVAILAGLLGIGVIFYGSLTRGSLVGDLCALGTAISLAVYLIFLRHARNINMLPSLALQGVLIILFVLPWAKPLSVSGSDLGILFLIGGVPFAAGMGLVTRAPSYIPATEVGLIMLLEAVLGSTWAWLILSENPGLESILGGSLVIGALVFNSLAGWKNTTQKKPRPALKYAGVNKLSDAG